MTSCTFPASAICFKDENATDKCRDSDLMGNNKSTRKEAVIKSTCHIRRAKSTGIVDFPRSVPVGQEWQNSWISHALRMVPFSGGFTNAGVARLWIQPMIDTEARLSSICWIRIKIYTRTGPNKWWRSKVWWRLPWWCGCNVERISFVSDGKWRRIVEAESPTPFTPTPSLF